MTPRTHQALVHGLQHLPLQPGRLLLIGGQAACGAPPSRRGLPAYPPRPADPHPVPPLSPLPPRGSPGAAKARAGAARPAAAAGSSRRAALTRSNLEAMAAAAERRAALPGAAAEGAGPRRGGKGRDSRPRRAQWGRRERGDRGPALSNRPRPRRRPRPRGHQGLGAVTGGSRAGDSPGAQGRGPRALATGTAPGGAQRAPGQPPAQEGHGQMSPALWGQGLPPGRWGQTSRRVTGTNGHEDRHTPGRRVRVTLLRPPPTLPRPPLPQFPQRRILPSPIPLAPGTSYSPGPALPPKGAARRGVCVCVDLYHLGGCLYHPGGLKVLISTQF